MSLPDKLQQHLHYGVVGLPTALATVLGIVTSGPSILSLTSGFGIGGQVFVVAMGIALVLMLAQATTFAEAATMLPTSGSVYDYISCGMGRFFAIVGTLSAYVLVHIFAGTALVISSGAMSTACFPALYEFFQANGTTWMIGAGMMLVFGVVNLIGITFFSRVEIFLTVFVWSTLVIFGLAGIWQAPSASFAALPGLTLAQSDLPGVLSLVGLAVFMFLGAEFVTPLAPELRDAARVVPRGMVLGLLLVGVCLFLYGYGLALQVPNSPAPGLENVGLLETPLAVAAFGERVMGAPGRIWLGLAMFFASAATFNTLLAGLPRLLYGMAVDGALPNAFAWLHPRFKTPVVGIVCCVLAPVIYASFIGDHLERILVLVLAAVCSWATSYLLVSMSVVVLRVTRPDLPRAFRSPGFPLPQIISSAGLLVAMWFIAPPGVSQSDIYLPFGLMLVFTAAYALFWTVRVQRVSPFLRVPVETILEEEFGKHGGGAHG